MRLANMLRGLPLAAAALASVATSTNGPAPKPVTCTGPAAVYPAAIELGAFDPDAGTFTALEDGDSAPIDTDDYDTPVFMIYARIIGEQLPFCVEEHLTVYDEHGDVIGELAAALGTTEQGPAARTNSYELLIPLSLEPRSGSTVVVTASIGDAFLSLDLTAP